MNILLVDDDLSVRLALTRLLRKEHNVRAAASGMEALHLIEQDSHYDAVVCDMMMPEMSGRELYEIVCYHYPELAPNFLFITGGTPEDTWLHGKPTLYKPFLIPQLHEALGVIGGNGQSQTLSEMGGG